MRKSAFPIDHSLPTDLRLALALLLKLVSVAAIYFLLARLGLSLASVNPSATPVWPPTGFALAMVLLVGYPIAAAVFAGALLANIVTAGSLATSLAIATGNTLECLIGAFLINRWSDGNRTFETPAAVAKFTLIVLFVATPVSATIGVGSLSLAGFADWALFRDIWITWWLGDVAGALLFTPLVVLWATRLVWADQSDAAESIAVLAAAALVALIAFSPLWPQLPYRGALSFLAVLPLLWAALRRDQRDTATVAFILSAFAIWGAHAGVGPFLQADVNESYLLLLAFMITATVPSLALSATVGLRRRGEEALRANEARIRALAETAPSIIWIAAPDGTITFHNRQWLDYTGIPAEANARDWPLLVLHPEDRERCVAAWTRALTTGEPYEIEVRNRRHDGEYRWFLTRATPVRDDQGRIIEWFGSTTDIQQLKEASARQTLLLAELSHRVRNMLAVVQSIAARTIVNDQLPEESRDKLNNRLRALARAHDLLIESSWAGGRLRDLLKMETEVFSEQVAVSGPDILLSPRAVQTFALLLHELTTNSCKYGALTTPAGKVTVEWSLRPSSHDKKLRLAWTERGGPPVTMPQRQGFGLTLLQRLIEMEYGLPPSIAFEPAGFRLEMEIPADTVVASASTGDPGVAGAVA